MTMQTLVRAVRVAAVALGAAVLLTVASTSQTFAQTGPYSAQIQRALASFVVSAHTWTGTQTFGIGLFGNGTACSAPSISFASSTTTGFYLTGGQIFTCVGGSNVGGFDAVGVSINQTTLHWSDIYMRRSAAKTLIIDADGAGGALTSISIFGPLTTSANNTATGFTATNGAQGFYVNSAAGFGSTANSLMQITNFAGTTGLELNVGVPTLGACTGGSMTSGSHNTAGEVTGNTSGSCIINFGTPSFTNTPFCFANDETTLTAVRLSARSASSITVTGAVSGDAFQFFCIGRIGT